MGLKGGHIEKVEIFPLGLMKHPKVQIVYLNKENIGWRQEKDIHCEFLVNIDLAKTSLPKGSIFVFRACFYGQDGRELYWEDIKIHEWYELPTSNK